MLEFKKKTWAISTRLMIRDQNEDTEDEFWCEKSRNKSYEALATLKAVPLQLNGMLMMWKMQQAKQDDAIPFRRIHPTFIPATGLKCSYAKFSSQLNEIPVGKTEIS